MNQPLWKRLLEPQVSLKCRYRRLLVLAFHGGYAVLVVFLVPYLSVQVLQAALIILLGCWLVIYMATGFMADKQERTLDERQGLVRDRAYFYAYLWLAGVAVVVYLMAGRRDYGILVMYVLLSYVILPSSVIAWLEPDPPAEEVLIISNA